MQRHAQFMTVMVMLVILMTGCTTSDDLLDNNPRAFIMSGERPDKRLAVMIGNSITHGQVSFNYVDELAKRESLSEYYFVNAGVNGDLAYNVLQRIDEIIQCNPHFITVMIGANDLLASLCEQCANQYIRKKGLPQKPNQAWFENNLIRIVDILKKNTKAKIALLSLSPITEDETHHAYQKAAHYSTIIKKIAIEKGMAYLPVNETMHEVIHRNKNKLPADFVGDERSLVYKAYFYHIFLGKSWDDISSSNGFILQTDYIHLNSRGAFIIADLIDKFLKSS